MNKCFKWNIFLKSLEVIRQLGNNFPGKSFYELLLNAFLIQQNHHFRKQGCENDSHYSTAESPNIYAVAHFYIHT